MLERSGKIPSTSSKVQWPDKSPSKLEALEASYAILKDELKVEDDRSKVIEGKLQGVLSLVPLAMTIVFAGVTLLTSDKFKTISRTVAVVEVIGAFYIALQILRALIAVINGLSGRGYYYFRIEDTIPKEGETKEIYLNRTCKEIFEMIRSNREVTNEKMNQLSLSHTAIRNAVWGLFIVIGIILTITMTEIYIWK